MSSSKKRVAIIIDTLKGGGAEKVMLTLAKALGELGHSAELIVLTRALDYELPDSVRVSFLYNDSTRIKGFFNGRRHAARLEKHVAQLEAQSGKFNLFVVNLEESYRVVSYCAFESVYYVIHNSLIETLARTLSLGPIKYLYLKHILARLANKQLIAVSEGVAQEIRQTQVVKSRAVSVIYNPFEVAKIRELASVNTTSLPNERYIIHIGRAAKQKRHDVLFAALKDIDPSIKLVCLSSGENKLQRLATKLGVAERVIFPGFQQNPYPWIAHAELMVLSSDYEGYGAVLCESLICNTLAVSTDCPHGPSEILKGELAQLLVPRRDPKALARKINDVLNAKVQIDISKNFDVAEVEAHHAAKNYLKLIQR